MGAWTFQQFGHGADAAAVFRACVDDALHEHGHGGYSGTIAEKSEFVMIQRTPLTRDLAEALAERLIEKGDRRIDDKWGPAGCIPVCSTESGPTIGFLFFGWASF